MNITKYMKAGYGCLFIETTEIKRAVKSIKVNDPFKKVVWDFIDGYGDFQKTKADQIEILEEAVRMEQSSIILENFDLFIDNPQIAQMILNNYEGYKSSQTCLVIVGTNSKKIPTALKELIPTLQFDMPSKEEIKSIMEGFVSDAKESLKDKQEDYNLEITEEVISACSGLSWEEIENILALSLVEHKSFSIKTILEKKREIIRATGFMDFMSPEPIENLGGLDNLKNYIFKRKEAFTPDSIKPKLKSLLLLGMSGTGKTQSAKAIASIFNWPLIMLDVGALKGGIVGDTERNVRLACKTIDSMGNCCILIDEIEKSLGNSKNNLDSGVSQGMVGYLLTWMQERKSEGIVIATANDISSLPSEMLRSGRWDSIFYTDLPNATEIGEIVKIMNKKYNSELPEEIDFYKELEEEGWVGAEIEQLAKDSHFDSIENAKTSIPLLSEFRKDEIELVREKAKQFRPASIKDSPVKRKPTLRAKKSALKSRLSNLN